jgi:hypothetical protein
MYSILTVAGLPAIAGRAREAKTRQYIHNFTYTVYAKICMQEGTGSKCHSDGKIQPDATIVT